MPELIHWLWAGAYAVLFAALVMSSYRTVDQRRRADRAEQSLGVADAVARSWESQSRYYARALETHRKGSHDLTTLAREIHSNAQSKGWYESRDKSPRCLLELIALVHSELSEAVEEIRDGQPARYIEAGKPEGYGVELADALIRILDMMAYLDLDPTALVAEKMAYNATRPHRHGGKLS